MGDGLALPSRYRREVERILGMVVADVEVWAYGSRVTGSAYEASDLDLVLRAPGLQPLPPGQLGALTASFQESNIPIIVDIHDWALLPEWFRRTILTDYMIFRHAGSAEGAPGDGWFHNHNHRGGYGCDCRPD